jgi:hypothetical protein
MPARRCWLLIPNALNDRRAVEIIGIWDSDRLRLEEVAFGSVAEFAIEAFFVESA